MSATSQNNNNDSLFLHGMKSVVWELLLSPCVCSVYKNQHCPVYFRAICIGLDAVSSTGNLCSIYNSLNLPPLGLLPFILPSAIT